MRRHVNQHTQPFREMVVFQNWDVVAEGWYFALPSRELSRGQAQSLNLCGQHVVLFRGEDGHVRALDGFCPHMGTDLGIGMVKGDRIACHFHQWEFGGEGRCEHIPCGESPPESASLQAYATTERYGAIWVFPRSEASFPLPEFESFEGEEVRFAFARPYTRSCHHHVTMINGIDPQHLRTVHGFAVDLTLEMAEPRTDLIDFALGGACLRRAGCSD